MVQVAGPLLLLLLLLLASAGAAAEFDQVAKLTTSDAAAGDLFGMAVSLSGNTALVGACGSDNVTGSAYVFQREQVGPNAWGKMIKLTASDAAAGDFFGDAVSLSGDTALVGAPFDNDGGSGSGSAYIFERNQGGSNAWGQVAKLTASDAADRDWFGRAVSLSGDTALVAAPGPSGNYSGAAYIFQLDQGGSNAWDQVAKLTASDAAAGDYFGISVSLSGDTALVGASGDKDSGGFSGSAYIFQRNQGGPNAWGQVAKLTASDAADGDWFGLAVSLSGDTALVGAYGDDSETGSAYIFERNQGGSNAWGQVAKLTANDAAAGDNFGLAVSVSGDMALVGAWADNDAGDRSGSAYIFQADQGGSNAWGQVAKLTASDAAENDGFGYAISLSNSTALVGAWAASYDYDGTGSAYIFQVPTAAPTTAPSTIPTSSPTVDSETAVGTAAPTAAEEVAGLGVGAIVGIAAGVGAIVGAATALFMRRQFKSASPAAYDEDAVKVASVYDEDAVKVASVASDNPGYGL